MSRCNGKTRAGLTCATPIVGLVPVPCCDDPLSCCDGNIRAGLSKGPLTRPRRPVSPALSDRYPARWDSDWVVRRCSNHPGDGPSVRWDLFVDLRLAQLRR